MTAPRCACGQPVHGASICKACERELTLALLAAVVIGPDLDLAISRQARFTVYGQRGSEPVLPFDERASAAAGALRNELAGWVRVLSSKEGA